MPETILYQSERVKVGRFEIAPSDPDFNRPGWVDQPLVVFPKTTIWIQYHGGDAFVSDLSNVNFYNRDQAYRRAAINPQGDCCHWIELNLDWLNELTGREKRHFQVEHVACDTGSYLKQLRLLQQIDCGQNIDELALDLVTDLLPEIPATLIHGRHRKLMEAVKETIHADLSVNWSLQALAKMHATSACHLSRVFKAQAGIGISQYRQQQRLRQITWQIKQGARNFSALAHELGYSSHAHMSASFKAAFGLCPRDWAAGHSIKH